MDVPEEHRQHAPSTLGFAVITASDSRTRADDTGGRTAAEAIVAAGHRIESRLLVPDDVEAIRNAVAEALGRPGVDVVLITGGTGVSPRDVTIEAMAPLFEKEIEGFGELFRALSYAQVGSAAMLSRATAGVRNGRALFLLPGSPKAVALGLEKLILPEAAHLVSQARRT